MGRAESEYAEAELIPPGLTGGSEAANLVAQGVTLMRIENESMLAVAIQRPRNEEQVLKGAIKELQMVPEQAKRAYYSIPYRERQPDGTQKMVRVEGPSIKASMALARRWGNCSVTARSLKQDATGAELAGIFIDFETNFRVERPMWVSKVMKRRGGGTYTLDPQRWLAAFQSGASKAARNAAINGLPDYLVAAYIKQAKTIAAGDPEAKADPKRVDKVLEAFKRFNVTLEVLEAHLEVKRDGWMGDDLATLVGLGNAIKDGQMTVAEAFDLHAEEAAPAAAGPATTTGAGALTPEAVAAGQTTGTDNAPAPAAPGTCSHPDVPPSAFAGLGPDATLTCKRCGEELANPNEEAGGETAPAPTPGKKPRQGRLE
jgi:hypothetical protein